MRSITLRIGFTLPILIAGILATGPVLADKPAWAGNGNGNKHAQNDKRDEDRDHDRDRKSKNGGGHFSAEHRNIAREYYGEQFRRGNCPPGLAKKHNGCMPPGQAKKWRVGRPLPHDVVYYDLPPTLVVQLGRPPSGYRYVRVAGDILMIAVGTSMVVDAVQDLGRR
jgi:Ni/Co efflux regulator RcnB